MPRQSPAATPPGRHRRDRRRARRRFRLGACLAVLVVVIVTVVVVVTGGRPAPSSGGRPTAGGSGAGGNAAAEPAPGAAAGPIDLGSVDFRWPSSIWATKVTSAPVASTSAAQVAELARQVRGGYSDTASFNVWSYNTSLITAGAGQARTNVAYDDCQHKGYTPSGLLGPGGQFTGVPLPKDAQPSKGTDSEMTVYSPSTDQLWEFWKIKHTGSGWSACWGGRIDHVSSSPGYFSGGFGAAASGLVTLGGAVTIAEARAGTIDHAVALAILNPAPWKQVSWPAQRSDGSVGSTSDIPEGTRFRLDPSVDVADLGLSPIGEMIAVAAQKFGFIVTDKAGTVAVMAQSGQVAQAVTGVNPWTAILGSVPSYAVLKNFPWSQLEALPASWGRPASAAASPSS